jgi:hypothetical protein
LILVLLHLLVEPLLVVLTQVLHLVIHPLLALAVVPILHLHQELLPLLLLVLKILVKLFKVLFSVK